MKKTFSLFLVILIAFSAFPIAVSASGPLVATKTIAFADFTLEEDFNDYSESTDTSAIKTALLDGTGYEVHTAASSGSLKILNRAENDNYINISVTTANNYGFKLPINGTIGFNNTKYFVEFDYLRAAGGDGMTQINNSAQSNAITMQYVNSDTRIMAFDGTTAKQVTASGMTADTWFHVKMCVDLTGTNRKYNAVFTREDGAVFSTADVEGADTQGWLSNRNTQAYHHSFGLMTYNTNSSVSYDNIVVYSQPSESTASFSANEGEKTLTLDLGKQLKPETVTNSNFTILKNAREESFTISPTTQGAVFTLENDIEAGDIITLKASKNIKDAGGKRLTSDQSFTLDFPYVYTGGNEEFTKILLSDNFNSGSLDSSWEKTYVASDAGVLTDDGSLKVEIKTTVNPATEIRKSYVPTGDTYSLECDVKLNGDISIYLGTNESSNALPVNFKTSSGVLYCFDGDTNKAVTGSSIENGKWYRFKLEVAGDKYSVYLDGEKIINNWSQRYNLVGKNSYYLRIFANVANSTAYFDNIRMYEGLCEKPFMVDMQEAEDISVLDFSAVMRSDFDFSADSSIFLVKSDDRYVVPCDILVNKRNIVLSAKENLDFDSEYIIVADNALSQDGFGPYNKEIYSFKTKESGFSISEFSASKNANNMMISLDVVNNTLDDKDILLIYALYDGSLMKDIQVIGKKLSVEDDISVNETIEIGNYTAKVFLWDSFSEGNILLDTLEVR